MVVPKQSFGLGESFSTFFLWLQASQILPQQWLVWLRLSIAISLRSLYRFSTDKCKDNKFLLIGVVGGYISEGIKVKVECHVGFVVGKNSKAPRCKIVSF